MLGIVSVAGAVSVLYLAYASFNPVRQEPKALAEQPKSWLKGIITNLLNPHPWVFWLTVFALLLFREWLKHLAAI